MTRALALCELAPYHHDELSRMGLADLGEKLPHPDRVHLAAQPPIQLAFQRADRAIDVHKFPFVAIVEHRAQGARRPAPLGAPSVRTGPRPETSRAPAGVPPPPGSAGLPTCPRVFSTPPGRPDRAGDAGCPGPHAATHAAPVGGTPPRLRPSALSAQPAPPVAVRRPTRPRCGLAPPTGPGRLVLLRGS